MVFSVSSGNKMRKQPLDSYHLLTNHARYNRKEMDAVIHPAMYVTIIRKPVANFESTFGYFDAEKLLKVPQNINSLEIFFLNPNKFVARTFFGWQRARNGQLFDLGLSHEDYDDQVKVQNKIKHLDSEFDLVLITEYFDESLILLKKLMCWSFEDILYVSKGIRSASHRYALNDELQAKIREWNHADVMLYNHFNKTFWRKIKEYGDSFQKDLSEFRNKQRTVLSHCVDDRNVDDSDRRENKFILKSDAIVRVFCKALLRGYVEYTRFIRNTMVNRDMGSL
ncbi:galactose-3-O-sulfotransferase 3-like [Antedon mediterranea]|uniref:galactose-3-O-sulfotransferase 3-like n=1 Tax=Antedon mediterranea TaxID=105859 RepID=UPI003AF6B9AB